MTGDDPLVAPIRLARSIPRLLAWPLLLALANGLGAAAVLVTAGGLGSTAQLAIAAVGGLLAIVAVIVAGVLLSVRLVVEQEALRLSWLGGERRYPLARGAVTRLTVRGPQAASLTPSGTLLGWSLGRAVLRGEEEIRVVRLAPARTVILVPTERGRVAIAAKDEAELLDALSRAAQARRRGAELLEPAQAEGMEPEPEGSAPAPVVSPPVESPPVQARLLTGIERARLEEQPEAERVATVAGERLPAEAAPLAGATESAEAVPAVVPVGGDATPAEAGEAVQPAPEAAPLEAPAQRRLRGVRVLPEIGEPGLGATTGLVLMPIVVAGSTWAALTLGWLPTPEGEGYRLTTLSLALGGPATSLAAILTRIWWPRLVSVVVLSGLLSLAIAGRALAG